MVIINCLQGYTLFNIQVYHIIEFLCESHRSVNLPTVGPDVFALSPYNVFAPREVKRIEDQPSRELGV